MSAELEEQPVDAGVDEPDVTHFWCCDPTIAWCGEVLDDDGDDEYNYIDSPDDCALCILAGQTGAAICGKECDR